MNPDIGDGNVIKYAKKVDDASFLEKLEPYKDILARMEHSRWCAEKCLNGWEYGPRNDKNKKHPDLLPFDELESVAQKKDLDTVENMCRWLEILRKV